MKEKTDNELIAEFMGLHKDARLFSSENLKFDTSWDWLMPVVAQLNEMYAEDRFYNFDHDIYLSMRNWVSDVVIENAFGDVVTMIKWYNKENNNGKI